MAKLYGFYDCYDCTQRYGSYRVAAWRLRLSVRIGEAEGKDRRNKEGREEREVEVGTGGGRGKKG